MFDSHAGCLGPVEFGEFSLPYLRDISKRVKERLKDSGLEKVPMVRTFTFKAFTYKLSIKMNFVNLLSLTKIQMLLL